MKNPGISILLCCVAAILFYMSSGPLSAQKIAARTNDEARLTVPVYVDGKGPFNFLVDTAATTSAISTEIAGKLELPSAGSIMLQDAYARTRVEMATVSDLRFGGSVISNLSLPKLSREDIGADGILGVDAFRDQQVFVDMKRREISIGRINGNTVNQHGLRSDQVSADRHRAQMFVSNADINGYPITIVIDSGASTSIINPAAKRILGPASRPIAGIHASLVSVSGKALPLTLVNLPEVRIGNYVFTDTAIVVADIALFSQLGLASKPTMLMGMDLLSKFDRVALDFRRKRVTFLARPSSLDMQLGLSFGINPSLPPMPIAALSPSVVAPAQAPAAPSASK